MHKLMIKRIYEAPSKDDGFRILVDRLWPRGVSKAEAHLDLWLKDIAPSPNLRIWFNHEADKFKEFSKKYDEELKNNPAVNVVTDELKKSDVTLLYAAKSPEINHAIVLQHFIQNKLL